MGSARRGSNPLGVDVTATAMCEHWQPTGGLAKVMVSFFFFARVRVMKENMRASGRVFEARLGGVGRWGGVRRTIEGCFV